MRTSSKDRLDDVYVVAVVVLLAGGLATIYAFGFPFFLLGIALAAIRPFRRRPWFPQVAAAVVAGVLVLALVAPASCVAQVSRDRGEPALQCSSVVGIEHSERGRGYGLAAAAAAGGAVSTGAAVAAVRRRRG